MKTILLKSAAALLAFLIGVGLFLGYWNVWLANQTPEVEAVSLPPVPIQITYCEIVDRKPALDGKLVSFEATAYVINDGTIILFPENCSFKSGDNADLGLMGAELNLESYFGKHSDLKALLKGKDRESKKEVDVRVTGTAKLVKDSAGYKTYSIIPTAIEIVSPFRKFIPKGGA